MKDEQAQRKEAKRKRRAERAAKPKAGALSRGPFRMLRGEKQEQKEGPRLFIAVGCLRDVN